MPARKLAATEPSLKGAFPFRLGTTSYIVPDDLLPNVEYLAPLVDDVELVLFESAEFSNLPDAATIARLDELGRTHRLTYTVHLPLDVELGSRDDAVRARSVEKCRRVVDLTRSLDPFAYIVHFHGDMRGAIPSHDIPAWTDALDRSARELLRSGTAPESFCVETLDYPFGLIEDIVVRHGMSICLDVGHLAFYGYPIAEYLRRYLARCRVVHLHGHRDGDDHKGVDLLDSRTVDLLTGHLVAQSDRERVLTLEVFGVADFAASVGAMRRLIA